MFGIKITTKASCFKQQAVIALQSRTIDELRAEKVTLMRRVADLEQAFRDGFEQARAPRRDKKGRFIKF